MLLTCPDLAQANTHQSWDGGVSSTLAMLQSYVGYGYYGLTADTPCLRTQHLGAVLKGDRLNQAGTLRFRMLQQTPTMRECLPPRTALGSTGVAIRFGSFLRENITLHSKKMGQDML